MSLRLTNSSPLFHRSNSKRENRENFQRAKWLFFLVVPELASMKKLWEESLENHLGKLLLRV